MTRRDAFEAAATPPASGLTLASESLARLMPMYLWLSGEGRVQSAGPTLLKLAGEADLIGANAFEVFDFRRPRNVASMQDLRQHAGLRLHLALRDPPGTGFRGLALPLAQGEDMLLNLSFGISVAAAVRDHDLTDADFAPTDLTVEMLYLAEAKTAVMEELHDLNRRLQTAKVRAEEQALTDALTRLSNRRAMDQVLDRLVRSGTPFGLMHIDLDLFKEVNDSLGHAAGDQVLISVAKVLREETRVGDTVARVGGDEFVLVFPGLAQPERLGGIARRIIESLSQPIEYKGHPCRISASIGMTVSSRYLQPRPDRMLSDADHALYASKNRGRSQATFFSEDLPNYLGGAADPVDAGAARAVTPDRRGPT